MKKALPDRRRTGKALSRESWNTGIIPQVRYYVKMKSNIPSRQLDRKAMREIAKEELRKQKQEFCPACQSQMENQTIAVMLYALNKGMGFGKKRLQRVYSSVCGMGQLIHCTGNWYNDVVAWLRDEMGIDLEKE